MYFGNRRAKASLYGAGQRPLGAWWQAYSLPRDGARLIQGVALAWWHFQAFGLGRPAALAEAAADGARRYGVLGFSPALAEGALAPLHSLL